MEENKLNQSLVSPPPADNKHFNEAKTRNMELIKVNLLPLSIFYDTEIRYVCSSTEYRNVKSTVAIPYNIQST